LGANLEVSDASNVKIVDNEFVNTHRKPVRNGAVTGLDPNAVIWLADCRHVTV
jgi:hypothetical protein